MKNLAKIFLPLLALSLLFAAGCSSDSEGSSAPEYCGEYTATPQCLAALNQEIGDPDITFTEMGLTMHESGGFALSGLPVPISGTYTETGANTFRFELDKESQDTAQAAGMAEVFQDILNTSFTYADGTLSAAFAADQPAIPCFKKS